MPRTCLAPHTVMRRVGRRLRHLFSLVILTSATIGATAQTVYFDRDVYASVSLEGTEYRVCQNAYLLEQLYNSMYGSTPVLELESVRTVKCPIWKGERNERVHLIAMDVDRRAVVLEFQRTAFPTGDDWNEGRRAWFPARAVDWPTLQFTLLPEQRNR